MGAPTRFIRVLDRGFAIILHQLLARRLQQAGNLVRGAHQRAVTDVQLVFQLPQGHAIDVMLHRDVGQQPVTKQGSGQHARRRARTSLRQWERYFCSNG